MQLHLTVNGTPRSLDVPEDVRLLDVLRDHLGLTGAKEGCGVGECGACSVLLDGVPVHSCLLPAFAVQGADVVTVEGLGTPEHPHPVQASLSARGGVQCGYCTPGVAVAAAALLADHPHPDEAAVRGALAGHLCRCTGYTQITEAIRATGEPLPAASDRVGASPPMVDALAKATGTTRYTADLPLPPGTLHGAVVRARVAHGLLRGVDASRALALPGVHRVLTAADVPGELLWGNAVQDQPVLAHERVRFWGEGVALVLAESPAAARDGAAAVRVDVEELPPLLDPAAALADGAPALHPDGNLLTHLQLRKGDAAEALAGCATVIEATYRTPSQEHAALEPEVALAIPEADGLTIHAPSQNVFFDRHHLCRILGLDRRQVRVIQEPTGAAFGSREDLYAQPLAALGAWITQRPVRVLWSREETQVATTKRHPAVLRYRLGADADGRMVALVADVLADTGAYASWGPNVAKKMLVHAAGAYALPHVSVDVRMAYTNRGISGAFRGYGAPQVLFAVESIVDELAAALGVDPVAYRRRHLLRVGDTTATGQQITGSWGMEACLDRALAAAGPPPVSAGRVRRGRGVATVAYGIGYGHGIRDIGSAVAELDPDGFTVRCGAVDYGQGARTVFTQIAGEVLGVSRAALRVVTGDSATTPDSGSTVASRQTYVSGEAVRQAAERLRDGLLTWAAGAWEVDRVALRLADDGLWAHDRHLAALPELHARAAEAGVRLRRQARNKARTTRLDGTGQGDPYWPYAPAVHVVDVEVDDAGQVRVLQVVAAHDVGKAIHPEAVRGQIAGGVAQGLGLALMEEHLLDERGVPLTRNLDTYRLPGAADVPPVTCILVEDPEPTGPFGAKGVGEPTLVATPPATAAAVRAATGKALRTLPLTPTRVLA